MAAHPETKASLGLIGTRAISFGFDDTTFNGLSASRFIAADGTSTPVRWSAVPVQTVAPVDKSAKGGPNYLFDALAAKVRQGPVQW